MEECISSFKEFYVHFLKTKVFELKFDSDIYMKKMMRQPYDSVEARTQHLESLLTEGTTNIKISGRSAIFVFPVFWGHKFNILMLFSSHDFFI